MICQVSNDALKAVFVTLKGTGANGDIAPQQTQIAAEARVVGCGSVNYSGGVPLRVYSSASVISSSSLSALTLTTHPVLCAFCGLLVEVGDEVWEHHLCPFSSMKGHLLDGGKDNILQPYQFLLNQEIEQMRLGWSDVIGLR
ncbi:uncharacterized protein G2W53_000851 [Senna tora]|uniref:Uncharacterized protein n=1 Tax=Senna tora TaxID=362788 RepID=A0A835CJU7_9FABA|nr:uncharacterized protein G2W53_000851 [Senna tora]